MTRSFPFDSAQRIGFCTMTGKIQFDESSPSLVAILNPNHPEKAQIRVEIVIA
jgi:hypothetical protein